eukprot:GFUD01015401.1.p1 GENE.GFUD01015401.1~~GFUD01015401.1.p1  ORF type:complete len:650 (+),score=128.51 GFUD01015401.1:268-2217(+)
MPTQFCTATQHCSNHQKAISKSGALEKEETKCKELVIIGNGPSGISLSYLLSGHLPFYKGGSQDEFLHTRLMVEPHLSLVEQDLQFLSDGLEGRSNNPVSLLLDALQKPEADLGLEEPSLLEWRFNPEKQVDHIVLGRGQPGGIWQTLDGSLLTVSLGAWMELPNFTMAEWKESNQFKTVNSDSSSRRTSVANVSKYYTDYVDIMGIAENFRNSTVVTAVKQVKLGEISKSSDAPVRSCPMQDIIHENINQNLKISEEMFNFEEEDLVSDDLSSQCSSLTQKCSLSSASVDSCEDMSTSPTESSPSYRSSKGNSNYKRSISSPNILPNWDPILNPMLFSHSYNQQSSFESISPAQDYSSSLSDNCRMRNKPTIIHACSQKTLFEVTGYEVMANAEGKNNMQHFKYLTENVVLATGQSDLPNRLNVAGRDLPFVLHNLQELEKMVETGRLTENSDPVMIVGAGLSAADAIISTQNHGFPIVHVFRKSVANPGLIFNKLPVAIYPEYHAVHRMMASGQLGHQQTKILRGHAVEREYPGYQAFGQTEILEITKDRQVLLGGPETNISIKVSYIVVLIGASPNLSFMTDAETELGRVPGTVIDRDTPIDIDVYTHESTNVPGLYAMGPLTGDNFVRFIQGGALAIATHVNQKS